MCKKNAGKFVCVYWQYIKLKLKLQITNSMYKNTKKYGWCVCVFWLEMM